MDEKAHLIQQQLESSDSEERLVAARQLSCLHEPSMKLFAIGLGDPDWRVRKVVVETFHLLDHPEIFISDLIKLLYHPENAGLRNAAIEILIGLGSRAVPELLDEISETDVEVRKFVIDILGEIGDQRCVANLVSALNDADINVRYAAVETLGKLRVEAAVQPLLELMADPDIGLKFTVLQSLSQIGGTIQVERLFPYLDDRLLCKALFDCFGRVGGSEVIPPLVDGLSDPMRQVREAALLALDSLRSREIAAIKSVLATADVGHIASNLELFISGGNQRLKEAALALYGSVAVGRDLSLLLNSVVEEGLGSQVMTAFAELGEESFACLVNGLDAPTSLQLRSLIIVGGELGFVQALPLALESVRSADPQLRNVAARALGGLGSEAQFEPLKRLLDDEVADIRDTAATAVVSLAKRHKKAVLGRISPMLTEPAAGKRMRVVRILGLIDGEETEEQLLDAFKDSSVSVRCEAIRALNGHFAEKVISGLNLLLTDDSAEVRRLAASALCQCARKQVLPALILAAADADLLVRAAVMRGLAHFTGPEVRDLLLRGLADPVGLVVIAALESMAVVAPVECRKIQENALFHSDTEVVKAAMDQLSRFVGKHWIGPFSSTLLNHSRRDVRLHAVRSLGRSGQDEALGLLKERLTVEPDCSVRQAIESLTSCQLRADRQGL
jgi:HEAT repeat protein